MSVEKTPSHPKRFLIDSSSGFFGGVAVVAASQPFDTVKTKLQAFPKLYNGSMQKCVTQTWCQEGLLGLYRGSLAGVGVHATENALLFLSYEHIQNLIKPQTSFDYAKCGSIAGLVASFVVCPTELIKCRFQAAQEQGKTPKMKHILAQIFREKGGFFQGITSTWIRDVPGFFFYFYGKELFMSVEYLRKNLEHDDALKSICSGTFAGLFYWAAILPFDNVKTRIQVEGDRRPVAEMFMHIARSGPRAFYTGFWVTMMRAVPANIALFYAYDKCRRFLYSL